MILLVVLGCRGDPKPVPTPTASDTLDSGAPADTADPCGPLWLEVGNGRAEHSPIEDGATVVMVHGIQGGWHIDVSGEVSGMGPIVAVHASVTRMSDGLVLAGDQQPKNMALDPLPGLCGGTWTGLQSLLDDVAPPMPYQDFICSLVGERLLLEVDVTDLDDPSRVALGVREVIAAPWMYDDC